MEAVSRHRMANRTLAAVTLVVWCGWASGFAPSGTGAFATWSASLAVVAGAGVRWWWGRSRPGSTWHLEPVATAGPEPDADGHRHALTGVAPWLVVAVVVLTWEILGIDTGPTQPHLTLSALSQAFRPFRAATLGVWMAVGLGYGAARARSARPRTEPGPPVARWSSAGLAGAHPVVGRGVAPALLLPANRAVGVGFWVGVVAVCGLVELMARRSGGRVATAGELVRLVSRPTAMHLVVVGAWAYAGWHLFAH